MKLNMSPSPIDFLKHIADEINYISEKTSWLINGIFSAGTIGIDEDGIFEVLTFEA